jgi:hypothetical protein
MWDNRENVRQNLWQGEHRDETKIEKEVNILGN